MISPQAISVPACRAWQTPGTRSAITMAPAQRATSDVRSELLLSTTMTSNEPGEVLLGQRLQTVTEIELLVERRNDHTEPWAITIERATEHLCWPLSAWTKY